VCSHCHPFFTGEQRIVDTAGRVERFLKRYGLQESGQPAARTAARSPKGKKQAETETETEAEG
jgi:large subunit ribosomal protein L31